MALVGHPTTIDTTTNQKHVGAYEGVQGKRFDQGRAREGCNPIILAAIEVKTM
jgi:hypothetical protein